MLSLRGSNGHVLSQWADCMALILPHIPWSGWPDASGDLGRLLLWLRLRLVNVLLETLEAPFGWFIELVRAMCCLYNRRNVLLQRSQSTLIFRESVVAPYYVL